VAGVRSLLPMHTASWFLILRTMHWKEKLTPAYTKQDEFLTIDITKELAILSDIIISA
jgi:hypothetical protein